MQPIIIISGAGKLLLVLSLFFSNQIFCQQAWTRVPVPDTSSTRNILNGISGTSSSDVWAVGHFEGTTPGSLQNQVLHWNGTGWEKFSGTDLSSTYNDLRDITVISASDAWAVGSYVEPGNTRSQLMHWNGTGWTHTTLPPISGGSFLEAIDAISSQDIWAVGGKAGSPTRPGYAIHYDGSGWTEFPAASPGTYRNYFSAVDGKTSSDVWAVGFYSNAYGDFHAMVQHWDGNNWSNVTLPSSVVSPIGELYSVTVISSSDAWALGSTITGNMILIHWDGTAWSEISTTGAAGGIVISRGTDVYSVGDRISQWNGSSWSVIDPLTGLSYPTLISATVFSNGDIWTCGRINIDVNFFNLVYRTANATPEFTQGSTQYITVPVNGVNVDQQLNVQDPDISQVVIYKVMTAPSFGTITGLPDTSVTSSGFAITEGARYDRQSGYIGPDQFVVEASVGNLKTQTTIMVSPLGALPVVLDQYSVSRSGNTAVMKWRTLTEENSQEFIMERSFDGLQFVPVNRVDALGVPGDYTLVDNSPGRGTNFYRLKGVDHDGRVTYFESRRLVFDTPKLFTIDQNPAATHTVSIRIHARGEYTLGIYDQQGRMILAESIDHSREQVTIILPEALLPGIYVVSLRDGRNTWSERLLVK